MKWILLLLALVAPVVRLQTAFAAAPSESLSQVADRVLTEGEEAKLNAGFAKVLGLKTEQPLVLKRLRFEKEGTTNVFNVLLKDRNTIILSEYQQSVVTFYLTDRAGNLVKAVANDSAIANGGLTNLTPTTAAAGFNREKKLWLQQKEKAPKTVRSTADRQAAVTPQARPTKLPSFGAPAEGSIRVEVSGYGVEQPGYYFLARGATVRDVFEAARGTSRVYWRRPYSAIRRKRPDGTEELIWFKRRESDEKLVLQNGDIVCFSHEVY
jgi:hypothetical protein